MAFLTADDGCLPALLEVPNGAVRISNELAITSTDMNMKYFSAIPADKLQNAMQGMSDLVWKPMCMTHALPISMPLPCFELCASF